MRGAGTSYRGTSFSERMKDAPCRESDADLSFPKGSGKLSVQHEMAKADCARCPLMLRDECLEVAMQTEGKAAAANRYGVFGGLDPEDRAKLAKERRARAANLPKLVRVEVEGITPSGANQTPVGPALGHLRALIAAGHSRTDIAKASGLSHSVICALSTTGPRFIKGSTYTALMSVREAKPAAASEVAA